MKGIQKMMDLYKDGDLLLASSNTCSLNVICQKKSEQIMCIPPLSKLEEVTLVNLGGKGHVSRYYNILVANSPESACDKLKVWKLDIKEDIDETDWNGARLKAQTQTINTRFKLLQYKWDVYRI